MRLRDTGEAAFLRALRAEVERSGEPVRLGIGDDAAVIACPEGHSLVLTCDAAVEGRHFRRDWFTDRAIGGRAVRAAVSDLAAMGASPAAVLLTLVISPDEDVTAARDIVRGAAEAAEALGGRLAGGETVGNEGPLTLDVTAVGFVPEGHELRRAGAHPGDLVLVSGPLGDSAAGLAALEAGLRSAAAQAVIARCTLPQPRIALGLLLSRSAGVHAAIDVSDGLLRDAGHIAELSEVGIVINADALPISAECRAVAGDLRAAPLEWAVSGGEDFELLFTLDPDIVHEVRERARKELDLAPASIGTVVEGAGVRLVAADGSELTMPSTGWDQFSDD